MSSHRTVLFLLILFVTLLGGAGAQRPLSPPNYYLFELPELQSVQRLEGELARTDGVQPYLSIYLPSDVLLLANESYSSAQDQLSVEVYTYPESERAARLAV